ncbi:MAG: S24 family peptidase [Eubacteriales bacterium]|nr:S24 family peptidase [Eubacteriales bacterium]
MNNIELNRIREQKKISYTMLEQLTGITKSTLQRYMTGSTKKIPHNSLKVITEVLGVAIGDDNTGYTLPVLGEVKGGLPNIAEQEIIDYETVPHTMADDGDYFALKISGNSMAPRINDGDIVIVKRQSDVRNGEVAIVRVGYEATCKKVYQYQVGVSLVSNNSEFPPMFYSQEQAEKLPVTVIGKVVELRARNNF